MRSGLILSIASLTLLLVLGCAREETEAELAERVRQAQAEQVASAEAQYDASVFDTLTWVSPEARLERGAVVWRASCEKCHGGQGAGNGPFAVQEQMAVPSFLAEGWLYVGDLDGIRRATYVGHEGGMPNWGLHLKVPYRDVDAVSGYISEVLVAPTGEQ
ncbi:MAG: c-type cytochrome [Gemmatimonadota bacterium]|nr:MAG: c-type cytochrome [Gemmatimonadota bacterium]